jgi:hypothetical protein
VRCSIISSADSFRHDVDLGRRGDGVKFVSRFVELPEHVPLSIKELAAGDSVARTGAIQLSIELIMKHLNTGRPSPAKEPPSKSLGFTSILFDVNSRHCEELT